MKGKKKCKLDVYENQWRMTSVVWKQKAENSNFVKIAL